jgi:hypothetical protein
VPTVVVERVVSLLADADALRHEIETLNSAQLADLLTRLEDFDGHFQDDLAPAIPVLYQLIPRLPARASMLDVDPAMRVTRVVLRMLRGHSPTTVTTIVEDALEHLPLLSDRWSLIRLAGHVPDSGHELVSDSQAKRWENALVEAVLSAEPRELADEPDLSRLLGLAMSRQPDQTRAVAQRDVEDDDFLIRLLSGYKHEVRSDFARGVQLIWDKLVDLLGEELLVRRVGQLPDLPADADEDAIEMLRQARKYASNPQAAADELQEYRREYPG